MRIIDGKTIAAELVARLSERPAPRKFFGAAVIAGDPASEKFVKQKAKVAEGLGIEFRTYVFPREITTDKLRREVARLAGPNTCGGFIVELPLPPQVNRHYALNGIPRAKDVDLLSESALGAFYTGRSSLLPPAVGTVEEILRREKLSLRECAAVLMGQGFLTGKPVGFWLQSRVAELTVIDEHAKDLRARLKDADIVVSGVGEAGLFSAGDLKPGALVIDFGWDMAGGKAVGDFNPAQSSAHRIAYTPTPGGTGPVVVAKTFENFYMVNGAA